MKFQVNLEVEGATKEQIKELITSALYYYIEEGHIDDVIPNLPIEYKWNLKIDEEQA